MDLTYYHLAILTLFPYTAFRKVWGLVYTKRVESRSVKQVGKGTSNKALTINKKIIFLDILLEGPPSAIWFLSYEKIGQGVLKK